MVTVLDGAEEMTEDSLASQGLTDNRYYDEPGQ